MHVRLSTGAEVPDLGLSRALDLAIAYGDGRARPGIEAHPLGSETLAPLVSPTLLTPRARPESLIQQLPLIDSTLSPLSWAQWFERQGLPEPRQPRTAFDRAALAIAAAGFVAITFMARVTEFIYYQF